MSKPLKNIISNRITNDKRNIQHRIKCACAEVYKANEVKLWKILCLSIPAVEQNNKIIDKHITGHISRLVKNKVGQDCDVNNI